MSRPARHVACLACRERKIRCDGNQPSCRSCARKGKECVYDNMRRNDSILETLSERLARAEAELAGRRENCVEGSSGSKIAIATGNLGVDSPTTGSTGRVVAGSEASSPEHYSVSTTSPPERAEDSAKFKQGQRENDKSVSEKAVTDRPPMQGIDLGQALSQAVRDELRERYFDSVHHCFPIVDKTRYLYKLSATPDKQELRCLNHAIWMHGAFCSDKYGSVEEMCYQNARSLLEHAEMSSEGASFLTIESLQTCLLIAVYEIKRKYFTRAYISLGRALRLAQLMKCHLLDSDQAVRAAAIKGSVGEWPLPQPIPLAAWLEVEEKRRVFWVGFVLDRCMNSGQDWPMMLEDNKTVDLPSADLPDTRDMQRPMYPCSSGSLQDYLSSPFPPQVSLFAKVVVVATLWGYCMKHLHEGRKLDAQLVLPADFWARHHEIENLVLQLSATASTTISPHTEDPNAAFLTVMLHTITIYLHHGASAYALRTRFSGPMDPNSDACCETAAMEIAETARAFSATNSFSKLNPFAARCLYAAAQVLVQRIKGLRGDARFLDSLHSILAIMDAWKKDNPLVELYVKRISQELEDNEMLDPTLIPY